jgi:hypothetical protein
MIYIVIALILLIPYLLVLREAERMADRGYKEVPYKLEPQDVRLKKTDKRDNII